MSNAEGHPIRSGETVATCVKLTPVRRPARLQKLSQLGKMSWRYFFSHDLQ